MSAAFCVVQVSSFHDDDDRYGCGALADVEVFTTSGTWEPWCEQHAQGWPDHRVRPLTGGSDTEPTSAVPRNAPSPTSEESK